MLLHYLTKRGNTKIAFLLKCCINALPEFNQSLLHFFSLFDSRLILALLYDSLNFVINAFSSGLLGGMVQEKGSRERCGSWTVVVCIKHQCDTFWVSSFALGNAEALDRRGGKTKRHLISYFLSNTSAKIIAIGSCMSKWDVF